MKSLAKIRKKHTGTETTQAGFTLVELMVVMLIIGILIAIAVPSYEHDVQMAREAVLKEDLQTMRKAIDSYTVDKQKGPQGLDDLVSSGYLKSIPVDPVTRRSDTWMTTQDDAMYSLDQTDPGITNVHSGAQQLATDGTSYSTW
jgi:general secretion pathway protein G